MAGGRAAPADGALRRIGRFLTLPLGEGSSRSMPIRIPIGEFARSCRLTVKALRHYDELGLLTPDHVARKTSYRYYTHDQAKSAIVIAMLRDLDVPLPTIRAVLAAKDPERAAAALRAERIRIERAIRRAHTALASLDQVIAHGALVAPDVVLHDEPAHDVYCLAGTSTGETHVVDTTLLGRDVVRAASRRADHFGRST